MRIGICDWGIGGLGFYKLLRTDRPDLDVIYLGDQGFTPYGRVPTNELTDRMRWVFEGFRERGVAKVVVACNAASTVLNKAVVGGLETYGVIQPALNRLVQDRSSVGVIGGRRTILSGSYRRPLAKVGIPVRQRVAQPLSRLIEDGRAQDDSTISLLHSILRPIRNSDRLVLACTHYVVLTPSIQEFMPSAKIVDPASETWELIRETLPERTSSTGTDSFYTTGEIGAMEEQSVTAFGVSAKVQSWY